MKSLLMIHWTPVPQMAQFAMNSIKAINNAIGARNLGPTARPSKPITMTVTQVSCLSPANRNAYRLDPMRSSKFCR